MERGNMSATREKLQESEYWRELMTLTQAERDTFKYNLSAFLSASRSVTLIMQKEYDRISGFKQWWSEKQGKMRNDDAMKLLNEKRVMTIHTQPVRPRAQVNITIEEQVTVSDSFSIVITHADGTVDTRESEPTPPPVPAKTESNIEWRWYFDKLPKKDVLTLCKEHAAKLDALVKECESRFAL
jgi:hypothetical protein